MHFAVLKAENIFSKQQPNIPIVLKTNFILSWKNLNLEERKQKTLLCGGYIYISFVGSCIHAGKGILGPPL